jgi:hypothetical protein
MSAFARTSRIGLTSPCSLLRVPLSSLLPQLIRPAAALLRAGGITIDGQADTTPLRRLGHPDDPAPRPERPSHVCAHALRRDSS